MAASSRFFGIGSRPRGRARHRCPLIHTPTVIFSHRNQILRWGTRPRNSQGSGSDELGLLITMHVLEQVDAPPPRALQHSTQPPWFFSARQSSIDAGKGPRPTATL